MYLALPLNSYQLKIRIYEQSHFRFIIKKMFPIFLAESSKETLRLLLYSIIHRLGNSYIKYK